MRSGEKMGFKHVEAGPLVRSSYHAFEQEVAARVIQKESSHRCEAPSTT